MLACVHCSAANEGFSFAVEREAFNIQEDEAGIQTAILSREVLFIPRLLRKRLDPSARRWG